MNVKFGLSGLGALQAVLTRFLNTFTSGSRDMANALQATGDFAADLAGEETHKQTGTLASAHAARLIGKETVQVYISGKTNPKTGISAAKYGPVEHRRGGSHAFYERTTYLRGPEIAKEFERQISRGLP